MHPHGNIFSCGCDVWTRSSVGIRVCSCDCRVCTSTLKLLKHVLRLKHSDSMLNVKVPVPLGTVAPIRSFACPHEASCGWGIRIRGPTSKLHALLPKDCRMVDFAHSSRARELAKLCLWVGGYVVLCESNCRPHRSRVAATTMALCLVLPSPNCFCGCGGYRGIMSPRSVSCG